MCEGLLHVVPMPSVDAWLPAPILALILPRGLPATVRVYLPCCANGKAVLWVGLLQSC